MKTIYHSILFNLFICFVVVCCSEEQHIDPSIGISDSTSLIFDTTGGNQTVSFTSAKSWTASSGQSWCKVTPTSGNGGTMSISISADENTTYDERNTSITIQSETVSKRITITQKQKDALMVTSNKLEVTAEGGSVHIELKTNVDYSYEIDKSVQEWISVGSSRTLNTSTIELQIKRNEEFEKREGKIFIRSGNFEEIVTVFQEGASPDIVLTQNEYIVGSNEENITIQLKSNISYQMLMPEGVNWLQIVESRSMSDYTHYLKVFANDTYEARTAEILFVNELKGLSESVKITQVQNDAVVVAQNVYELDAVTTELEFEINANVAFEVYTSDDWIKYQPDSRVLTAYPLSFVIDENISVETREGMIILTSGDLKQEIKVVQKGRIDKSVLSVIHTNWNFLIPKITGHYLEGTIDWGDDRNEIYIENTTHVYELEGNYSIRIDLLGAEEVEFRNLVGIKEIDLSCF